MLLSFSYGTFYFITLGLELVDATPGVPSTNSTRKEQQRTRRYTKNELGALQTDIALQIDMGVKRGDAVCVFLEEEKSNNELGGQNELGALQTDIINFILQIYST